MHDILQDIYFWYTELPAGVDPASFNSPEAYLEAVRFRPLDTTFSFVADKAADDAFFSDSQFIGIGLGTQTTQSGEMRLTQVFPDSPASEAGLRRGDSILAIDGHSIPELIASGTLGGAFGASQVGVSVSVHYRDQGGREGDATLTKRLVTIPTVSETQVYDVGGRRVGYILFRNFVQPSTAALDAAFAQLEAAGATELVLDLRYNGGGLVTVAQYLGGLIGGQRTNNQIFGQMVHNDKNSFRNQTLRLSLPLHALGLAQLVVITTHGSASASELIINGLRPFIPVTVVGDTTYGKPVGQYSYSFCNKVFHPVAFTIRNASGQGDYFGGIPADCPAPDDLDHQFGDPAEGSLGEALHFIQSGSCSSAGARATTQVARRTHVDGWQLLVGAY